MATLNGQLNVRRKDDQLLLAVTSFTSSDIAVQLSGINDIDWRVSVEQITIDTDYDGKEFRPDVIDVPETATDYVKGEYSIPVNKAGSCIAVKITDILGQAIILTQLIDDSF